MGTYLYWTRRVCIYGVMFNHPFYLFFNYTLLMGWVPIAFFRHLSFGEEGWPWWHQNSQTWSFHTCTWIMLLCNSFGTLNRFQPNSLPPFSLVWKHPTSFYGAFCNFYVSFFSNYLMSELKIVAVWYNRDQQHLWRYFIRRGFNDHWEHRDAAICQPGLLGNHRESPPSTPFPQKFIIINKNNYNLSV